MTRAERRANRDRIRAKMRRHVSTWSHSASTDQEWADRTVAKMANHGKLCSCFMCGNPRRHFGELSMQERRAAQE